MFVYCAIRLILFKTFPMRARLIPYLNWFWLLFIPLSFNFWGLILLVSSFLIIG